MIGNWLRGVLAASVVTILAGAVPASAQTCNGCNIVYDYGIDGVQIGQTYELFNRNRVVVLDIDYYYGTVLLRWDGDYSGQQWWEDAGNLYGVKTAEAPRSFDDSNYRGLVAACETAKAYKNDNLLMYMLMRRGCCESAAARAYPEVSDPVCR